MWYKFASDEYDLSQLNREVKIDDAVSSVMDALSSGESLDLSDKGFKSIKVINPAENDFNRPDDEIDVENPRQDGNYHHYNGIALDHFQGIAFACQFLLKEIDKILPTFNYIKETFWPIVNFENFDKIFSESKEQLNELNFDAINQMIRSEEASSSWEKYNNIPIWSKKHPQHDAYNDSLNNKIDFEVKWCQENVKVFWKIWHNVRQNMFNFLQYVQHPLYIKLWRELIPV